MHRAKNNNTRNTKSNEYRMNNYYYYELETHNRFSDNVDTGYRHRKRVFECRPRFVVNTNRPLPLVPPAKQGADAKE